MEQECLKSVSERLHSESVFRKLGSDAVLRSVIRILRASLAQIDTEMAEKYTKLGKAAKFRSLYDIGGRNPVSASGP